MVLVKTCACCRPAQNSRANAAKVNDAKTQRLPSSSKRKEIAGVTPVRFTWQRLLIRARSSCACRKSSIFRPFYVYLRPLTLPGPIAREAKKRRKDVSSYFYFARELFFFFGFLPNSDETGKTGGAICRRGMHYAANCAQRSSKD